MGSFRSTSKRFRAWSSDLSASATRRTRRSSSLTGSLSRPDVLACSAGPKSCPIHEDTMAGVPVALPTQVAKGQKVAFVGESGCGSQGRKSYAPPRASTVFAASSFFHRPFLTLLLEKLGALEM